MANLHDADLTAVGSTLSTPEVTTFIRNLVRNALQELIESDFAAFIGALPHERTDTRTNQRNGHRPRLLSTQAGDIELLIPKTRTGSYLPKLLQPPAGRPSAVCGDDDRLHHRHVHPKGR